MNLRTFLKKIWKRNIIEFFLLSIFMFFSGVFFLEYPYIIGISLFLFGLPLQIKVFLDSQNEIRKKIDGNGVLKITASENEPENPAEGEMWIKYKKNFSFLHSLIPSFFIFNY
jgi:hypothetical protein